MGRGTVGKHGIEPGPNLRQARRYIGDDGGGTYDINARYLRLAIARRHHDNESVLILHMVDEGFGISLRLVEFPRVHDDDAGPIARLNAH